MKTKTFLLIKRSLNTFDKYFDGRIFLSSYENEKKFIKVI